MYAQRRKKKRSSNRIYRVDLERGSNGGFGFSISGEKPCAFSCVAKTSPVYGLLKAGDYLIAVKDLETDGPEINVSKMPHDQIVDLISNAPGRLRLAVAERLYFSSDEETEFSAKNHQHLTKPMRAYNERRSNNASLRAPLLFPYSVDGQRHVHDPTSFPAATSRENLDLPSEIFEDPLLMNAVAQRKTLEFKIVVGYLGTIEMPKQIATSSKHTTVKGCIRKLRQDKRTPSIVLMTILPGSLTLTNAENVVLANYPAIRLNYVSGSSENNSKYFGLVTSATYANGMMCDTTEMLPPSNEVSVSNSCHVFVVDKNITEHGMHLELAAQFKIECTRDQVTGYCLEFPTNSEYIVSLIKSMYTRREEKPVQVSHPLNIRNVNLQFRPRRTQPIRRHRLQQQQQQQQENQLSNNSGETTTSSSNSDSGIGFHNDCTNISDRIVVVDFPHQSDFLTSRTSNMTHNHQRPIGIIHEVPNSLPESSTEVLSAINNPIYETVYPRKLPFEERPIDVPEHIISYTRDTIAAMKDKINVTQSCDDLSSCDATLTATDQYRAMQMSADNLIASYHQHQQQQQQQQKTEFLMPQKPLLIKKTKKSRTLPSNKLSNAALSQPGKKVEPNEKLSSYKLSPKVFGLPRPISMSFENLSSGLWSAKKGLDFISSSVQDLTEGQLERNGFIDGTISEPDLVTGQNQAYNDEKSPFHRKNQASFRSLSDFGRNSRNSQEKLSSSENSVCKQSTESLDQFALRGPTAWANSLEKLLEDKEGIHIFAEFLKKEISAENIYFWAACERYRHMNDIERAAEAPQIYDKYLGPNASEPVNVDSKARSTTRDRLALAESDLFDSARKQIFNLMKFDSYSRFLKSDLYKTCLESENKKQKRGMASEQFDPLLNIYPKSSSTPGSKIKKSYSNAEDRRRTSLLPWHRKIRSQSKDRLKEGKKIELKDHNKLLSISKSSVNDVQVFGDAYNFDAMLGKSGPMDDRSSNLCRIVLPDGANSISQVRDEPIQEYVNKILEKRGINYKHFEVFYVDKKCSQSLDLTESALTLAHQQIKVEQRVLFKLDLPNKKVISVKSKANKMLSDVLKPILNKYSYKMEEVQGFVKEQGTKPLDTTLPVTSVEDKRLLILYKNCDDAKQLSKQDKSNTLDEITNKVFNEVLQGKIDSESVQTSVQSEDFYSEASSTRHRNLLQLPTIGMKPVLQEECDTEIGDTESKKPLIAKLKAGVKLQTPDMKAQELLAEIKRAQRTRLEDQRGTEITIPLPEFLLKDNSPRKPEPAPRLSLCEGQNVFNKIQNYEMNVSPTKSHHSYTQEHKISPNSYRSRNFDEGEIAYIDSNIGDTTLVFHHDSAGSSNSNEVFKKFSNSPPPLPPKPRAKQSNENSPSETTTHFPHTFPSGTFI